MTARSTQSVLFLLGFAGLCVGFVAHWLIFQPGNFSDDAGAVYIPLGGHGVYTSKILGIAWYAGVAIFLFCDGAGLIWRAIERRKRF